MSSRGAAAGKKAYDWAALNLSRLWATPERRQWYTSFRSNYEKSRAALMSYPEKPDAIDWSYYKKTIGTSNMVEEFQKKYEAVAIAYPKDTESTKIDEKEKEWSKIYEKRIAKAKENIVEHHERLDVLHNMKPFEEMTINEYAEYYPELKPLLLKAEGDALESRWYLDDDPEVKKETEEYYAKLRAERSKNTQSTDSTTLFEL